MEKMSLTALAREQLAVARTASSGRNAHTVYGGHEHALRQTLISITAGRILDEQDNPRDATLYVLKGRVRLIAGDVAWAGTPGDLLVVRWKTPRCCSPWPRPTGAGLPPPARPRRRSMRCFAPGTEHTSTTRT